jgi:hypothetical protein
MNLGNIKISLCNKSINSDYQEYKFYEGKVTLNFDVWNCYHSSTCTRKENENLYLEGIVQNIFMETLDNSKPIPLKETSSWTDGETYANVSSTYLIHISLCQDITLLKETPTQQLQITNDNKLILDLKGLSSHRVEKIKEYIKRLL